jgi:uncharacterized protein (DUF1499 family)
MTHSLRVARRLLFFVAILAIAGCSAVFPVGNIDAIDFPTFGLADSPNQYLVCPAGYCAAAPSRESDTYAIGIDGLRMAWDTVVAASPRTERVRVFGGGTQVAYVQRTAVLKFPDVVSVQFIGVDPGRSTLAIYSRSVYGSSDFGVNEKRVAAWLAALAGEVDRRAAR